MAQLWKDATPREKKRFETMAAADREREQRERAEQKVRVRALDFLYARVR